MLRARMLTNVERHSAERRANRLGRVTYTRLGEREVHEKPVREDGSAALELIFCLLARADRSQSRFQLLELGLEVIDLAAL